MSLEQVQQALQESATGVLTNLGIRWVIGNAAITPTPNTKWAQVQFRSNDITAVTMGDAGEDFVDGILFVVLRYPKASGSKPGMADFESIRAEFPRGHVHTKDGQEVVTRNSSRRESEEDDWYLVTVKITWYAFLPP